MKDAARLSMSPGAKRKRAARLRERESRKASEAALSSFVGFGRNDARGREPDEPIPLHETVPVTGPGASSFPMSEAAPESASAVDAPPVAVPEPPLVERAPEPAPEVVPDPVAVAAAAAGRRTAGAAAKGVGVFFAAGVVALLESSPAVVSYLSAQGVTPPQALEYLRESTEFVEAAARAVFEKHNLSFRYQDEAVLAGALGVGAFGFVLRARARAAVASATPAESESASAPAAASEPEPVFTRPAPAAPHVVEDDEAEAVAA